MGMRLSLRLWLGMFLLLCFGASAQAQSERVFRFRMNGDPETLDWNRAHVAEDAYLLMNLMEGLLETDRTLKLQPALAERQSVSSDGKTITFELRSGVSWQDGVPLQAADFVYSWRRLLSPLTAASYSYLLFDVVGARDFREGRLRDFSKVGIRAVDSRRLEVTLLRPVPNWLMLTTFWPLFPLRQDVVERHGNEWAAPGRMVTLGPYVLAARERGAKVVLTPNPRYWRSRGNLTRIEAVVVPEDPVALSLFEAGSLDFLKDFSAVDFKKLGRRPELVVFPYLATHYLGFSVEKYPVSLPAVRKAIAHAIDRKEVVASIGGIHEPAAGFIPPQLPGGRKGGGLKFDPLRARSLLRMSGIDPSTLSLEMLVQTSDKSRLIGEAVRTQLSKNLGIEVKLQPFEHRAFRAQLDLQTYPLFQLQWSADYPDAENFLSVFLPDSGNNRTGWKNPAYSVVMHEAADTRAPAPRARKFEQADELLVDRDVVIVPLYHSRLSALVSRRSKGVRVSPMNYLFLREVSVD